MSNEEEVDELMQYRKEFMKFIKETNFYEIMTHEDIETTLIIARCWLNNQKPYCQPARYGKKQFCKFVATQFCWKIKDEQIKELTKALELACEEINRVEAKFGSTYIRANGYLVDYFKTEAKEILKNGESL